MTGVFCMPLGSFVDIGLVWTLNKAAQKVNSGELATSAGIKTVIFWSQLLCCSHWVIPTVKDKSVQIVWSSVYFIVTAENAVREVICRTVHGTKQPIIVGFAFACMCVCGCECVICAMPYKFTCCACVVLNLTFMKASIIFSSIIVEILSDDHIY